MSADNFLITIPMKGGKIGLYDVSMSDDEISSDPNKKHLTCEHVSKFYDTNLIGVYENDGELCDAMDAYEEETFVEYGPLFLHRK